MTDAIVEKIMEMPSAPKVLDSLQHALEEEQRKREQFYKDLTPSVKAEFINGEVIIHSPAKKRHIKVSHYLSRLMGLFCDKFNLGWVGTEKGLLKLVRNDYEPDIFYFSEEKDEKLDDDVMILPAADLVIEILSPSTEHRDRGIKYQDYEEHGIEEYWIIDTTQKTVEQYHLRGGKYELILKASDGEITSFALKGFTIPIKAIFDKNLNMKIAAQLLTT